VVQDLLSGIGICVAFAALLALLGHRLRQPVILAYLVTGVLIGPVGLNLIGDPHAIATIAEIGLILLLFIIGLEIDLRKIASAGLPVILTGLLQVPLCIGLGLAFFAGLGYRAGGGDFSLLYLAACLSMSSTMIVVKLLHDKFELDTLPGRITLGVLVLQDIWAVAMLAVQPNLTNPNLVPLIASLLKGVLLILFAFTSSRYALPHLFRSVAKVPELVVISALAWCFFLAAGAAVAGLSREMGALIAGISLSTFPYNLDVIAKVTSIRDFFVTLFFVGLGMEIPIPGAHVVYVALAGSIFLIASRLVVVPVLYSLRLGQRASILPAVNLAQLSEFSIVIASLGLARGQIRADVVTVVSLVFAITSVTSTYMIGANHEIQEAIASRLRRFGVRDLDYEHSPDGVGHTLKPVVFLGFFRDASSILHELDRRDRRRPTTLVKDLLVVDLNPHVMAGLAARRVACVYGDIANPDTLQHAQIGSARLVVCTITDDILRGTTNLRLLRHIRAAAPRAAVILASAHLDHALNLYEEGADWVFISRLHAAAVAADVIEEGLERGFRHIRATAMRELRRRDEVLR
jgi:Kef-type K+ transport system membrane component KefB